MLTVIPEEMDEAIDSLGATEEVPYTGVFTSPEALAEGVDCLPFIVGRCRDRSNGPAADTARTLLEDWRPETIVLVGIAGGIRRLDTSKNPPQFEPGPELGDVVLGTMIHFGDYGKDLPSGFVPRWLPLTHPPGQLVMRHGEALRLSSTWGADIRNWPSADPPRALLGEIVAVERVAGNPLSDLQQRMVQHFDKAIAVDMESKGVAEALFSYEADVGVHYHPRWLVVRGISDLVVGSEAAGELLQAQYGASNAEQRELWRIAAARSAARAARILLIRLLSRQTAPHPEQPGRPPWPHAESIGLGVAPGGAS